MHNNMIFKLKYDILSYSKTLSFCFVNYGTLRPDKNGVDQVTKLEEQGWGVTWCLKILK